MKEIEAKLEERKRAKHDLADQGAGQVDYNDYNEGKNT